MSLASTDQQRGGEVIVKAVEHICAIARVNLDEMSRAAANLGQQAENLAKLNAIFRAR